MILSVQKPKTTDEFRFLVKHRQSVTAVVLSEDDSKGFSASKDGYIVQWDVETGKTQAYAWPIEEVMRSHGADALQGKAKKRSKHVLALAVSFDGRYLASGGFDRHIHLWDTRTREHIQLKELENLGPGKGVISQSVKDVVQSLVDDELVSKDKIGTSVYFWSLPSCAGNQLRNVTKKLESELQSSKKRHVELVEQCESLKKGREDSDAREEALIELKAIEQKYHSLKAELGQFADNDPATFEAMKEATKVAHEAANRWTDNIFTMRQWCSKNFPQAKEQLEHLYNEVGITEDFDYLELPAVTSVKQIEE